MPNKPTKQSNTGAKGKVNAKKKTKPKGKKNPGGRPPAFKSPTELLTRAEAYFASCAEVQEEVVVSRKIVTNSETGEEMEQVQKERQVVKPREMYTKVGLAVHLGVTKETLSRYNNEMGKEYSDAIKYIYARIEKDIVQQLTSNKGAQIGCIFYLKNAFKDEYRDRYDHTTDGEKMPAPVIMMYGDNDRLRTVMEKRTK